ncbi:hypothetical protein E8E12_011047 [Didymella heteroderae]|uniref:Uncharacterized protein n=1 Tax=Didymella heteroderae TaxID=1769908 RepID=A0A9P4WYT8_9PLEO|nr:hypothetical protein E8E12_011047 [Didymella heteroderae]
MSDNEGTKGKANTGWTDRERLTYLLSLIEHSDTKFNFKASIDLPSVHNYKDTTDTAQTAPLPAGRTVIACERMVGRLKNTLKDDLEALKNGTPLPTSNAGETPKATPRKTATPRKRKPKEDGETNGDAEGSPTKKGRGRAKTDAAAVPAAEDEEELKSEVKKEETEEV